MFNLFVCTIYRYRYTYNSVPVCTINVKRLLKMIIARHILYHPLCSIDLNSSSSNQKRYSYVMKNRVGNVIWNLAFSALMFGFVPLCDHCLHAHTFYYIHLSQHLTIAYIHIFSRNTLSVRCSCIYRV